MTGSGLSRARRLRDSDRIALLAFVTSGVALWPHVGAFLGAHSSARFPTWLEAISWTGGVAVLTGYGVVHVFAALADAKRYRADHGDGGPGDALLFCHALGQRLFVLLGVCVALLLVVLFDAALVPLPVLLAAGLFAASLIGLAVGPPMDRETTERLATPRE